MRVRGERAALIAAAVVALLATPILWLHYLTLLLVPIALVRPRLSPLWFLPLLLWVTPHPDSTGVVWQIGLVLVTIVGTGSLTWRSAGVYEATTTKPRPR
jgi:hypothetical protein